MSREIRIGFIGHGWIAGVHAHALKVLDQLDESPCRIRLTAIAGRDAERARHAADRLGFEDSTDDWRALVERDDVDVVANLAVESAHPEPSIAALDAGKSVLCEKPLALDGGDARAMAEAAARAGTAAACGFNWRFAPAVVLARQVLDRDLGAPLHFWGSYNEDWAVYASDEDKEYVPEGGGIIAGLSHVLDLATLMMGAPVSVTAETVRFPRDGGNPVAFGTQPHQEDAYQALIRTDRGALVSVGASTHATGTRSKQRIEVAAEGGAFRWCTEAFNHLDLFMRRDLDEGLPGFKRVQVTEEDHPYIRHWWPPGLGIGFEHTHVHQWLVFLQAVLDGAPAGEGQASFADAAHTAELCDAIMTAARRGSRVELEG